MTKFTKLLHIILQHTTHKHKVILNFYKVWIHPSLKNNTMNINQWSASSYKTGFCHFCRSPHIYIHSMIPKWTTYYHDVSQTTHHMHPQHDSIWTTWWQECIIKTHSQKMTTFQAVDDQVVDTIPSAEGT